MVELVVRKAQSKHGSQLSKTHLKLFNRQSITDYQLMSYFIEHFPPDNDEVQAIVPLVRDYTMNMMDLLRQRKVDEVMYIQTPTFDLISSIVELLIPSTLTCYDKRSSSDEAVNIGYETMLDDIKISGETDQVICADDTPVANVEVKNLDKICDEPGDLAKILAEDKGFCEEFHRNIGRQPPLFSSVLVSGRCWKFIDRLYENGNDRFLLHPTIETFKIVEGSSDYQLDEEAVLLVSRMVVRMIHGAKRLIHIMKKRAKEVAKVFSEQDYDKEEDRDDVHHDDDDEWDGPSKKRPAHFRDQNATTHNFVQNASDGQSGGSNLTVANLNQHDLRTLWIAPHWWNEIYG